jgi:hypothetical protein
MHHANPLIKESSGNLDVVPTRLIGTPRMVRIETIMARQRPYELIYVSTVRAHLRAIDSRYYTLIREAIEEQLPFEPTHQTRNRKPLRPPTAFAAD